MSTNFDQDDSVNDEWAKLAENRYKELESGKVKGVTWEDIKNNIINDIKNKDD